MIFHILLFTIGWLIVGFLNITILAKNKYFSREEERDMLISFFLWPLSWFVLVCQGIVVYVKWIQHLQIKRVPKVESKKEKEIKVTL